MPSERNYPMTEDGYRWDEEMIRSNGSWRQSLPFVYYEEIAVLFPQYSGFDQENLDDGELGLGALLVGQGYSSEEAQRMAKEQKEQAKEALENKPYLKDTHLDRSIALFMQLILYKPTRLKNFPGKL